MQMQKFIWQMFLARAIIPAGVCLLAAPGFGQSKARHGQAPPATYALKSSRLTGTYTRVKRNNNEHQSATMDVKQINRSKIHVHLTALWWPALSDLPHNGEFEATLALRNHIAVYRNENYRLTMKFARHAVALTESGSNPEFGVNVRAAGTYRLTRKQRTH